MQLTAMDMALTVQVALLDSTVVLPLEQSLVLFVFSAAKVLALTQT